MKAQLVVDECTRRRSEDLVRRVYESRGWHYYQQHEPVMFAVTDGERVRGVLCARPGKPTSTRGFERNMDALQGEINGI